MSFLDDLLADIEGSSNANEQPATSRKPSAQQAQMLSFQNHLREKAKNQAKRFRNKTMSLIKKFKDSSEEKLEFANETDEQRRYIIHEVAAEFGFTSRDEEPPEGTTSVKPIVIYKQPPDDEKRLEYEELGTFQKADINRQIAQAKREARQKKKKLRDPHVVATGICRESNYVHKPKDKRSMIEIYQHIKAKKRRIKEEKNGVPPSTKESESSSNLSGKEKVKGSD
eukprot:CAMPEP_0184494760 /NCGR_PEP_ID=MMETSP0113_2-20130426/29526_1 /TAXON_ID=91329 /ORGANISM="Norrisiella sphaerica, Strain BC52" /LENGTH=225 /DNA_ID=CAMNT_0026880643 /DNA_START=15 /DNA_END=692 /DNA_ORIENTATION=+